VIARERNGGPAAARNTGLAEAGSKWIAFLDGDDVWFRWRLASQFEVLDLFPDAALVCGEVCYVGDPEPGAPTVASDTCREVGLLDFLEQNPVSTSTVLVRAEIVRAVGGFDEQFRGPEDIDLWMRVARAGRIVCLTGPVTQYRERPGSLSMDPDRFLPQILRVYDKAFADGGALYEHRRLRRRCAASRHVSAAWTYLACGRRGRALRVLLRSWCLWPGRVWIEEQHPAWRLMVLRNIILNRA
jgi:glycosyltransferase involved in cell wall biosynthesis